MYWLGFNFLGGSCIAQVPGSVRFSAASAVSAIARHASVAICVVWSSLLLWFGFPFPWWTFFSVLIGHLFFFSGKLSIGVFWPFLIGLLSPFKIYWEEDLLSAGSLPSHPLRPSTGTVVRALKLAALLSVHARTLRWNAQRPIFTFKLFGFFIYSESDLQIFPFVL